MAYSMTGYGRSEVNTDWGQAICEIRTLNHRYLDMAINLPEEWRILEPAIKEQVAKQVKRGRLNCLLLLEAKEHDAKSNLSINNILLDNLIQISDDVYTKLKHPAPIDVVSLINFPNVILKNVPDASNMDSIVNSLVNDALSKLMSGRKIEGAKIKAAIELRVDSVSSIVKHIRTIIPTVIEQARDKFTSYIDELLPEASHKQVKNECVLLINKLDIAEELDRLDMHLDEIASILERTQHVQAIGRHIDFLIQEVYRETNTISSKSQHAKITYAAIDIKVLLDEMREQIQNLE